MANCWLCYDFHVLIARNSGKDREVSRRTHLPSEFINLESALDNMELRSLRNHHGCTRFMAVHCDGSVLCLVSPQYRGQVLGDIREKTQMVFLR